MSVIGPEAGRQRERAALAWRRTALALAGGCALLARVAVDDLLDTAWAVLGILCGLGALFCAEARYRTVLRRGSVGAPPALLVAGMAAVMTAAGLVALVLLL